MYVWVCICVQANDQAAAAAATDRKCKWLAKFAALRFGFAADVDGHVRGIYGMSWCHRTLDIGLCIFMAKLVTFSVELLGQKRKAKGKMKLQLASTEIFKCCGGHKSTYCQLFSNAPTFFHHIYYIYTKKYICMFFVEFQGERERERGVARGKSCGNFCQSSVCSWQFHLGRKETKMVYFTAQLSPSPLSLSLPSVYISISFYYNMANGLASVTVSLSYAIRLTVLCKYFRIFSVFFIYLNNN